MFVSNHRLYVTFFFENFSWRENKKTKTKIVDLKWSKCNFQKYFLVSIPEDASNLSSGESHTSRVVLHKPKRCQQVGEMPRRTWQILANQSPTYGTLPPSLSEPKSLGSHFSATKVFTPSTIPGIVQLNILSHIFIDTWHNTTISWKIFGVWEYAFNHLNNLVHTYVFPFSEFSSCTIHTYLMFHFKHDTKFADVRAGTYT